MNLSSIRQLAYIVGFVLILLKSAIINADQTRSITIATGEYPPWTSQSLPHGGYINRVVKEAFALSNIAVTFDYMPWKRALEATKIGQYHASSFWGEDPKRQEDFIHSDILDNIYFVFFYQSKSVAEPFQWNSLSELKDFRIGATRGYTYTPEFWSLTAKSRLRVSLGNNDIEGIKKLIDNSIDLFPLSEFTGQYLIKKHFSPDQAQGIKLNKKPLSTGKNYILFSKVIKENEIYAEIFNENLEKLKAQNKLEQYKKELF